MSKLVSWDPSTFSEGLPISDADCVIVSGKFSMYQYKQKDGSISVHTQGDKAGQAIAPVCAAIIGIKALTGDKVFEQVYTVGDKLVPTPDGDQLQAAPNVDNPTLVKSSNFALFLSELMASGTPPALLAEQRIGKLAGHGWHFAQKSQPKRDNQPATDKAKTIIVPTKYLGPVDKSKMGTTTSTTTAPTSSTASAAAQGNGGTSDESTIEAAVEILQSLIEESDGGKLPKAKISSRASAKIKANPEWAPKSRAILTLMLDGAFHASKAEEGMWDVEEEGKILSKLGS